MKTKLSVIDYRLSILLLAAAGMFFAGRGCGHELRFGRSGDGRGDGTVTRIDTVVVTDTLRDTVLVPVRRYVVRVDTVWLHPATDPVVAPASDTASGKAPPAAFGLPIERRVYATDDYRAVVEGFRPALVEMELYRLTTRITRETLPAAESRHNAPRWGIGIQAGYGFGPNGAAPYVGAGLQYSLITW